MKKIYKYPIELGDNEIWLPTDAQPLSVKEQFGSLVMWVQLDPDESTHPRKFKVFGTGLELPENEKLTFIDTCLCEDGNYVWHVFESQDDR